MGLSPCHVKRQFRGPPCILSSGNRHAARPFGGDEVELMNRWLFLWRRLSRELRRRIQALSQSTPAPDRIYQLNLQAFPVAFRNQGVLA